MLKAIYHQTGSPTQVKSSCSANDSMYILYGIFTCWVLWQDYANDLKEKQMFRGLKNVFEMFPTQDIVRCLPQRDPKKPGTWKVG